MVYIVLFIAAAAAAFLVLKARKSPGRRGLLREECIRGFNLPEAEAEKALRRHMDSLRRKYPGKDEEWCLEKILYDLGRDRR